MPCLKANRGLPLQRLDSIRGLVCCTSILQLATVLACDLMEPIRAQVDAYLLDWVTRQPLRREWFFEERDGNCRLMGSFAVRLSETLPIWRRAVAPVAEWVARAFWSTIRRPDAPMATRLTQNNKREAKGALPLPSTISVPRRDNLCRGCGKTIQDGRTNCVRCAVGDATKNMLDAAKIGRQTANGPEAQLKRANTQRKNALAQHAETGVRTGREGICTPLPPISSRRRRDWN